MPYVKMYEKERGSMEHVIMIANLNAKIGKIDNACGRILREKQDLVNKVEELEKELQHTQECLKASKEENTKADFYSNLTHEMKTPLNVILSALQLLEANIHNVSINDNKTKLVKYISIIKQNCYRQLRLVNNMLDMSKIDAGFTSRI